MDKHFKLIDRTLLFSYYFPLDNKLIQTKFMKICLRKGLFGSIIYKHHRISNTFKNNLLFG